MNSSAARRHIYGKEGRALAPILAVCSAAMAVAIVPGGAHTERIGLATVAYVFGAVLLGSAAIGHEYVHGTLGTYLVWPWRRTRLLGSKALVLLAALAVHVSAALVVYRTTLVLLPSNPGPGADMSAAFLGQLADARLWVLPPLAALCIAPALTMLCRNVLAGTIFTLAIPTTLWLAGVIVRSASVGVTSAMSKEALGPVFDTLWRILALLCVVGAPATWRVFRRLEAPGEILWSGSIARTTRFARSSRRRRRAHVSLLFKELRLQQMTFGVAALYVGAWAALSLSPMEPDLRQHTVRWSAAVYALLMAILVGSIASAEERAMGTLAAQTLAPVAAWNQWLIKSLTATALVLVLGVGLPVILDRLHPSAAAGLTMRIADWRPYPSWYSSRIGWEVFVVVTLYALHVSTLMTGGLRALLLAMPVVLLSLFGLSLISSWTFSSLFQWLGLNQMANEPYDPSIAPRWTLDEAFLRDQVARLTRLGALACLAAVLIIRGHRNHRLAGVERADARLQFVYLAACTALAAVAIGGAFPVLTWLLSSR
jgi:hypothetical protein